jgi:aspartyl-tRNA(Asn)/glutamyl-tRNA(Gln) amidotransferase subunit A
MSALYYQTIGELTDALAQKKTSSREATLACLDREAATRDLNAYLHVDREGALAAADAADARRSQGTSLGPLDGIPLGIKDIFLTQGMPTTCASRILEGFMSPYDATVVRRLKEGGAVLLGKLNMDEFAMGSSNEHSAYGPCKNPWDANLVPGGSSGGSAAAVAAGSAFAALGTDTGGSIRQPAAMTGTVGLKPTYGRVSRYGTIAYASSMDQVGPMTRDVRDCATLLQAIAGQDIRDATSSKVAVPDYLAQLGDGIRGLRVGIPKQFYREGTHPEVAACIQEALASLTRLGATLVDVSLPHTDYGIPTYYVLAPAEASSNLARYDGVRFGLRDASEAGLMDMYTHSRSKGFGAEVKRRIMLGTWLLSSGHYDAYYTQAQRVRTLVRQDFDEVFKKVDILATPTTPAPAFALGGHDKDPVQMYLGDIFTVTANLAGIPGISLPCGFTKKNLPVGLQMLGAPFSEGRLLQAAYAYEQAHDWHTRRAG